MNFDMPALEYMKGTDGHKDYVVVAKSGKVALGLKMISAMHGTSVGVPGYTAVAVRLRSTHRKLLGEPGITDTASASSLVNTWPDMEFDKRNSDRASMLLVFLVEGDFMSRPGLLALRDNLAGMAVPKLMAEYVAQRLPEGTLAASQDAIELYIDEQMQAKLHDPLAQAIDAIDAMIGGLDTSKPMSATEIQAQVKKAMDQAKKGITSGSED